LKVRAYTKEEYIELVGRAIERALGDRCLIISFGSVLTDRFSRTSDIEVGVFCGRELSPKEYVKALDEIEKVSILREVDFFDLAKVKNGDFLERVLKEGRVWKSSEELLTGLKKRLQSLKKD